MIRLKSITIYEPQTLIIVEKYFMSKQIKDEVVIEKNSRLYCGTCGHEICELTQPVTTKHFNTTFLIAFAKTGYPDIFRTYFKSIIHKCGAIFFRDQQTNSWPFIAIVAFLESQKNEREKQAQRRKLQQDDVQNLHLSEGRLYLDTGAGTDGRDSALFGYNAIKPHMPYDE